MAFKLVVVHPFKKFKRGEEITDPTEVAKWLASRPRQFVKVPYPDAPPAVLPPSAVKAKA